MLKLIRFFLDYYRTHKKHVLLISLSFILGAILFASVFYYTDYEELTEIIFQFTWWKFLIFLGISTISFFLTTFRWSLVIKTQGFKVGFFRLLQYRLAGFGFSYLTPIAEIGGAPFRAHLLKKEGIPFNKGLLNVIIDNFLELFTQAILVSLSLLAFISHFGFSRKIEWISILAIILFLIFTAWVLQRLRKGHLVLSPLFKTLKIKSIYRKLSRIERPFIDFFSNNKKVFAKTIVLTILNFAVSIMEIGTLIYLMGFRFGPLNIFFSKIILNISTLFPIPAGLGVSEWMQAGFFSSIMAGKSAGLIFSVLFRAKCLFFAFLGIFIFFYWWHKKNRWDKYLVNRIRQKIYG
jgi:uncharacterized protein (TIRG00374 family)